MNALFDLDDISVRYGDHTAVDGVSLQLRRDRITAIIGPNGCGKSTLLRTVARLQPLSVGRVTLDDQEVSSIPPRVYARRVAVLPQSPAAPESLTVADLVARGRDPHRRWWDGWSQADEDAVRESLAQTALVELADRPLESLSGGQRQRAWIALALAQRTDALLLDEPTTYLDIAHQLDVLDTVQRLHHERGLTVIMVLHDLSLAARYADEVVAMRDGRVVAAGTAHEVVTPDVLREVFDVDCRVLLDDGTGRPFVIPGVSLVGREMTRPDGSTPDSTPVR